MFYRGQASGPPPGRLRFPTAPPYLLCGYPQRTDYKSDIFFIIVMWRHVALCIKFRSRCAPHCVIDVLSFLWCTLFCSFNVGFVAVRWLSCEPFLFGHGRPSHWSMGGWVPHVMFWGGTNVKRAASAASLVIPHFQTFLISHPLSSLSLEEKDVASFQLVLRDKLPPTKLVGQWYLIIK